MSLPGSPPCALYSALCSDQVSASLLTTWPAVSQSEAVPSVITSTQHPHTSQRNHPDHYPDDP